MTFAATADSFSVIPLASLPAVVLDTETTGLDTRTVRIVQMGAVKLLNGRIDSGSPFNALVNPGIPIPSDVVAIHHITDAEVAGAPLFPAVMSRFSEWVGANIVIGYSIGFDLAVLKAEHERRGISWRAPRSLDIAHLVSILAPDLPGRSLELIAQWLDIEVVDRHQALGDARIAAEIFLALVPKLRERGILTLAQAERACLARASRLRSEAEADWHEVVDAGRIAAAGIAEYARIDAFPYRHRVRDIMSAPPVMINNDATVQAALGVMMRDKVSSLFLPPQTTGGPCGIVTERDILRAIDGEKNAALNARIENYAMRPLISLGEDEFVYRAIGGMSAKGFRHFGVTDASGQLVGALSTRDLLRQRASDALNLGDSIEQANSASELGHIWSELTTVVRGLVYEEVDARDIAAVISRELRALTRRACQIAEREMADAGATGPPVSYAMLVLGSGGRGESLLAMDQDNAIVFEAGEPGGSADQWFERLGTRVAEILNEVGVSYCKGGVMASNASWRMSAERWRRNIGEWITRVSPEDILNSDIFYDGIPVHGQLELGEAIRNEALQAAAGSHNFQKILGLRAAEFQQPVNWLGRFKLDAGRLDLKKTGLMPLFSTARVMALRLGSAARSTPERFAAAFSTSEHDKDVADNLIEAHKIFLEIILQQQLRDLERGLPLSNRIDPAELTKHQTGELRWALAQVPSIIDLLGIPLFREV